MHPEDRPGDRPDADDHVRPGNRPFAGDHVRPGNRPFAGDHVRPDDLMGRVCADG
ncbi:hypothetical protein ACFWPP_24085 [Streptomyces anulatus]|uniref:hypothetical protein n=1 Tax=Streptomyces anulatus TaxID=1892 RepID=UPI003665A550